MVCFWSRSFVGLVTIPNGRLFVMTKSFAGFAAFNSGVEFKSLTVIVLKVAGHRDGIHFELRINSSPL